MGDENPIHTLGDYSKPSHEGYKNTIELPQGTTWYLFDPTPYGSITTWEDLTTQFLAQFFLSGRTAKLRNDILMSQQHHGESISEAWTRFKDLLLKFKIDRAVGGKIRNKNADESWEIIENLALYDHEGWDETREFVKPVKAISTPQAVPKNLTEDFLSLKTRLTSC
nr:hypothetical protein [Tanacetum cinerariifolium]